jgi:hypothetical protein
MKGVHLQISDIRQNVARMSSQQAEIITSYQHDEQGERVAVQLGADPRSITLKDLRIYFEKLLEGPYFSLRDNARFRHAF